MNTPYFDPAPLSESTPGYMTMAFPALFPDGAGDFYQPRLRKVDLGEYFKHLLRFRGGRFAQHRRFPWFALNTLQRARAVSQSKVFVKQQHDAARLTVTDIRAMLSESDEHIVNQMMRYGANLRGTRAFWTARRRELMDLIHEKGTPDAFCTLSAADLQWPDLHRHMPQTVGTAAGEDPRAARQGRQVSLNKNPHIAAAYLDQRIQAFFQEFLVPSLGIRQYWYRYEWQERGSGHIHALLWLKDAPRADQIDWEALKKPDAIISPEQKIKMEKFTEYWNLFITASTPFPRHHDENTPLLGEHPCSLERNTLNNTKKELADLLNWTERHTKCTPGYCLVKRNVPGHNEPQFSCRFNYPRALRQQAGFGLDSKGRVRFEPKRNDPLLNPYNPATILAWRANVDLQPVLSKQSVINYIAKYASKAEKQAPAFSELLASVANSMEGDGTAQSACQNMLSKMLGERTYLAQETAHLLLGIPLTRASVTFETLYIGTDGAFRQLGTNVDEADAEGDRTVTSDSAIQRYMKRPPKMEALSIHHVLTKYAWKKSEWRRRKEKTDVLLRVFPRFSPDPQGDSYEDFCRTKVILHHPFRDLNAIRESEEQSWSEFYAKCHADGHEDPKDTLRCWEGEHREQEATEDEELPVDADLSDREEADWQALARLFPTGADIPLRGTDDIGRRPIDDRWDIDASRTSWNDVNLLSSWIEEQKSSDAPQRQQQRRQQQQQEIDIGTLAGEQRVIFDEYMDTYRKILSDENSPQMLFNIDGTAGCGKTYLIAAICQGLRQLAGSHGRPDPIRILAPSGVAALNVHGQTLHSGFGLPINGFGPLSGARLANMQLLWQGVHFVIIDEKSMLGLRSLAQIDSRCRQLFPQHAGVPFGKLNVALVGDFAQLPPVGDTPLYSPPPPAATENGCLGRDGSSLYHLFTRSFSLQIAHRQAGDSPEQIQFRTLLRNASQGSLTVDKWKLLNSRFERNLCPEDRILFRDCICLYTTRTDVDDLNLAELLALNQPCARIAARHEGGPPAAKATADEAGGLENYTLLAKGAKVMITRNIWQTGGVFSSSLRFPSSRIQLGLNRSRQRRNWGH
jgi:ATP-dependent DNA helicase PIF1